MQRRAFAVVIGVQARLAPLGPAKDSSAGCCELIGALVKNPPPTRPGAYSLRREQAGARSRQGARAV